MTLTTENFAAEVLQTPGAVLVDFWATWCGPCRMMAPVVETVLAEFPQVKLGKVDIDDQDALARQFGIEAVPTLILFTDGQPKAGIVGYQEEAALRRWLEEQL